MTTKTRQRRTINPNDPMTWTADPTTWAKDLTRPNMGGDERLSYASGMTPVAPIAANESAQGATGGDDTVTRLAPNAPTDNDNTSGPGRSVEFGTSEVNATPTTAVTQCEQCGGNFTARRPWARFCSAYCRRVAWLDRNPERAAELAERDKARYRAHVIGNGGTWEEVH